MRKAGAGDRFRYSGAHAVYTAAAKANRLAHNDNPFKAYRVGEVEPKVGDLVCKRRAGDGATYDTIRPGHKTHCDIVTQVQPGGLTTIGGNVGNSVSKTVVPIDSQGYIRSPKYFAVIRIGAAPPSSDDTQAAPVLPRPPANRRSRDYVRWLQQALNRINRAGLVVDGSYGPRTRNAVRAFQRLAGITADGLAGPQTERALFSYGTSRSGTQSLRPPSRQQPERPVSLGASRYFKDEVALQRVPLPPPAPLHLSAIGSRTQQRLGQVYNRLGGLMQALARAVGVDVPAVLAVWYVESGGRSHAPGRAIIRFENHVFYRRWGQRNRALYDRHFRHGGHNGVPGRSWDNHSIRPDPSGPWVRIHVRDGQRLEYEALRLARRFADEPALESISMGGPQIMGFNHRSIGYATPRAMYDAFQASERAHVLGFFDFVRHNQGGKALEALRRRDWRQFARYYNGSGQVDVYGPRIEQHYSEAKRLDI